MVSDPLLAHPHVEPKIGGAGARPNGRDAALVRNAAKGLDQAAGRRIRDRLSHPCRPRRPRPIRDALDSAPDRCGERTREMLPSLLADPLEQPRVRSRYGDVTMPEREPCELRHLARRAATNRRHVDPRRRSRRVRGAWAPAPSGDRLERLDLLSGERAATVAVTLRLRPPGEDQATNGGGVRDDQVPSGCRRCACSECAQRGETTRERGCFFRPSLSRHLGCFARLPFVVGFPRQLLDHLGADLLHHR